jgi:hypothetical protein
VPPTGVGEGSGGAGGGAGGGGSRYGEAGGGVKASDILRSMGLDAFGAPLLKAVAADAVSGNTPLRC